MGLVEGHLTSGSSANIAKVELKKNILKNIFYVTSGDMAKYDLFPYICATIKSQIAL